MQTQSFDSIQVNNQNQSQDILTQTQSSSQGQKAVPVMDPILQFIKINEILNVQDFEFLMRVWKDLTPIEKFKIKSYLQLSQIGSLLTLMQVLKIRFPETKKVTIFDKINNIFSKEQLPNKIIAPSILMDPKAFGNNFPQALRTDNIPAVTKIDQIQDLAQLGTFSQSQIEFEPNQDENVILSRFYTKIDALIEKTPNLFVRKCVMATYLQSPLYIGYINTALTAFKHPEIEPRKVVLNLLHSANTNFLSSKEFEIASAITGHLRFVCGY
jgi:hypothetical protein